MRGRPGVGRERRGGHSSDGGGRRCAAAARHRRPSLGRACNLDASPVAPAASPPPPRPVRRANIGQRLRGGHGWAGRDEPERVRGARLGLERGMEAPATRAPARTAPGPAAARHRHPPARRSPTRAAAAATPACAQAAMRYRPRLNPPVEDPRVSLEERTEKHRQLAGKRLPEVPPAVVAAFLAKVCRAPAAYASAAAWAGRLGG